ncbi:MAG: TraB family protein, partial [bacterium]
MTEEPTTEDTGSLYEGTTIIESAGRRIVLLGTAHVSQASVRQVRLLAEAEKPDSMCIEIDESRYRSLTDSEAWKKLDIYKVIRGGQGFLLLGNLFLASFQRRIGKELGVKPGAEMVEAVGIAHEKSIPVVLCDREIQITLKRAWASGGLWSKSKMMAALLGSLFGGERISEEDIESLKETDALSAMMEELSDYLPGAKRVLIDERDRYLAEKIYETEGSTILAV